MRFALIGHTDHWAEYGPMLKEEKDVELVAVTVGAPEETLERVAKAPGVSGKTKVYPTPEEMFREEKLDLVQVATRPDLIPKYVAMAVERGVAVMAEKPLAMDLETLYKLYGTVRAAGVPVAAMHAQRADGPLCAVKQAVASGAIGTPLLCHSQKSYKWRGNRPDYFRTRATFPGSAGYVGLHAIDWMYWILGDIFEAVTAYGTQAVFADYPACESHSGYLFKLADNRAATFTLDYLRPNEAPTHGDARVRVVGTKVVVESVFNDGYATLIDEKGARQISGVSGLAWYTSFVRAVKGVGESFLSVAAAFRITEIALKAQQALDSGETVSLKDSPYAGH